MPFSMALEKPLPENITVEVAASGFDLMGNDFAKKHRKISVDFNNPFFRNSFLSKRIAYSTERIVKEFSTSKDERFKIVSASPDSLIFDHAQKLTIKVPVRVNADVNYKKQFFQSSPIIAKPDSIEIAGPESELSKITFVETQKVVYENARKNIFYSAGVINPVPDKIILSADKVWVLIPVNEFTEGVVKVPIEKIYYRNKPVKLIPDNINVTYLAPVTSFSQIGKDDFTVQIREEDKVSLGNEKNKIRAWVTNQPANARIVSVKPELIDFIIEN